MSSLVKTLNHNYHLYLTYGVAVITPLASLAALLLIKESPMNISPLLLFFPAVVLSAWYGGARTGIVATGISSLSLLYLRLPFSLPLFPQEVIYLLEIFLFLIEGIGLSAAIEYYRRTDIETIFRKKERLYRETLELLEKEKTQAQEEIKARDEFLSIASHELRTPLTSMVLQLQTALHNIRNVSLAKFSVENLMVMLERTEKQSKRLTKMINDLLNVSLITTGRFDLELEDADLNDIVNEVIERFAEKIEKDNLELTVHTNDPIPIRCDRVRIEQVITNLVSNALKYGDNQPVTVTVTKKHGNGIITIKDRGIGIPKEKQDLIFGRFKRAVNQPQYRGLGVGLYICQQIIEAHGGRIYVESKEGKGSTFIVSVPLSGPEEKSN